jgi:hemerythrin superfamily protein
MARQTAASTRSSTSTRARGAGRSRRSSQDALALLRADHDAVLQLFEKFEAATRRDQKQKLADQICTELTIHATIEEEIFYPEIREAQPVEDIDGKLDEADVEHDGAKKLIAEIESSEAGAEMFDAQLKVLSEYIKHHVKEEYRGIFPAARKADIDLDEIGQRLRARKKELKAQLAQRH